jgi:hypothetical protein
LNMSRQMNHVKVEGKEWHLYIATICSIHGHSPHNNCMRHLYFLLESRMAIKLTVQTHVGGART